MTVPIHVPWDMYQGQAAVWAECLQAGVRRAVLLPRLDTIFSPREEDPAREQVYEKLDWRLVSPTETDWDRYRGMVEKLAARTGILWRAQRVETMGRWMSGRSVAVPQYHIWLYRDRDVEAVIDRLYDEPDATERRRLWGWLLAWSAPAPVPGPSEPR